VFWLYVRIAICYLSMKQKSKFPPGVSAGAILLHRLEKLLCRMSRQEKGEKRDTGGSHACEKIRDSTPN